MASTDYILGTHQEELERLGFQHRVWADDAHRLWKLARFRNGQDLLDLGCGPGFTTFDMAEIAGRHGSTTGIDKSSDYIAYAQHKAKAMGMEHAAFTCAEFKTMELPTLAFDGAYARWVFSWTNDVDIGLEKVYRSLRPGGVFALQEYIHWGTFRMVPEHPDVKVMIEACRESWRQMDSEIDIANSLTEKLEKVGFKITHIAPLERTASPGDLTWQWPTSFLRIYGRQLIELGLLTGAQWERYNEVLPEIEKKKGAFIVTPLMVEILAVKV